jgi:putative nucleotidyltransferase with HDIG domain
MQTTTIRDNLIGKATMLKVIPTVSNIVDKVLDVISLKIDASVNDLYDVIKYDQSISSKIISIANSAYYSRGIEIYSLQRAMLVIGFEEVKKIVMCLLFMNNILKTLNLKGRNLINLWKHSAYVACSARILSEKMLLEDPQKVFTISLLHDIGKTVMYMGVDNYHAILKEAVAKAKDVAGIEKELFGVDHQELGYTIGVKWHFPEEFLYAIRYHHENDADKYDNLLKLVSAADNFALEANADPGPEGFILLNEKETIMAEMYKIVEFLNIE